jgi:hypothetical protein
MHRNRLTNLRQWVGLLLACLLLPAGASAQDDLLNMLGEAGPKKPVLVKATFKSSRVINLQSVETVGKGNLDFRISHRFGKLNSGANNFFGLDQSTIRLGLEYGLTDVITVGVGRSSFEKYFDGFVKAKLLRQKKGNGQGMPLSVLLFGSTGLTSLRFDNPEQNDNFGARLTYTTQLIIGRKFNERFSLQVSPTYIHRNLVATSIEESDVYAVGAGGRTKLTKRLSFNAEYVYLLPGYTADHTTNSLSVGFDIETGGHVFQLHVSNSQGMTEQSFVARTTDQWTKGDIFYGFNISRTFTLAGKGKH